MITQPTKKIIPKSRNNELEMHFGNDERQKLLKGTRAKRQIQNDTGQKISECQIPNKSFTATNAKKSFIR